jgi:hypothetical protein
VALRAASLREDFADHGGEPRMERGLSVRGEGDPVDIVRF